MAISNKKIIVLFSVLLVALLLDLSGSFTPINRYFTELRFGTINEPVSDRFAIVAIDPASIEAVGQWPWPRRVHAQIIDGLLSYDVNEIALDIDLSQPSNPLDDLRLAEALGRQVGFPILPVSTNWCANAMAQSLSPIRCPCHNSEHMATLWS